MAPAGLGLGSGGSGCCQWRRGASPGVTSRARGKQRGTEGFVCGSDGASLPGGLKLILEKGILLVFRAFN